VKVDDIDILVGVIEYSETGGPTRENPGDVGWRAVNLSLPIPDFPLTSTGHRTLAAQNVEAGDEKEGCGAGSG